LLVTILNYKLQKNNNFRGKGSRKAKKSGKKTCRKNGREYFAKGRGVY
jgi:hypothetical protein